MLAIRIRSDHSILSNGRQLLPTGHLPSHSCFSPECDFIDPKNVALFLNPSILLPFIESHLAPDKGHGLALWPPFVS